MAEPPTVKPKELFILGLTSSGRAFRPSDWAERLCGVLSCYRPPGRQQQSQQHLAYSPYAKPIVMNSVKCVVIDERLRDVEPMAMTFVLNFARDNDLQVLDACLLPDPPQG
ncbi:uncharacterized protein DUF3579 [Limnobacter thiooxidans]|uniref:DUF3579 domain-containing protein n=1 Tax=Limnobacter thiooxidans TaxID=131080 RepID=A0AA86MAU0_9BURK|nr:uncharacterized protein DUF3579 [Limnobacter thiooxidans]BET25378.1 DUF3579 domain-containing protein [Limnobacter thiooxidans]